MTGGRLKYFLILMAIHGSLLVTSTVAGSKIFALPFGFSASATVLSYMCTFVILDTIAELYGRALSRWVINLGLLGMAISALYFQFAILLPPAKGWPDQDSFERVFQSSWRIWLAGWTAYIFSQNIDLWSFLALKKMWAGRGLLPVRALLSMVIGQFVDTLIFMIIAFYGVIPLAPALAGQYFIKVVFAMLAAPLVSLGVRIGRGWTEDTNS